MLGELNDEQIEALLKRQVIGRVACTEHDLPYIVPVNYVYNGREIICHSTPGKKIDMMRKNPRVCFQVDEIHSIFKWQSVVAWGRFEEITDIGGKERAMTTIIHRLMPFAEKPVDHPSHALAEHEADIGTRLDLIVYRIVLVTRTGRFEHR
ncbi:pyridoxamine 5'-phosphate oxidase family protein [Mucilaginibacter sp. UR6-11]|uniref:pyridoxamine 5'-phosphate oxidase family protein n=1 Tax=Mucilaginibacter sp. UR6-11 TaxID=1435644 RepID=UPI001E431427|nr:pyridoxamine 5'-phosphate oxidase family protein [Mucilaginibacter sp. UR6-11]MCC8426412.1 pyridoxamine 5'-phosphate oxidase family protein [Mucilaginibacter sp. UR6-11]